MPDRVASPFRPGCGLEGGGGLTGATRPRVEWRQLPNATTYPNREPPPRHSRPGPAIGIAGRMAAAWINSKLTPLFIVASLMLGTFSVFMLPREEEPQIIVPMVDIFVGFPGASA